MLIRAMTEDDLDLVMRLEAGTPKAPHWGRAIYEGFLSIDGLPAKIFVVDRDGQLIGFAAARIVAEVCELESIVVEVVARRTGVGKDLLAAVMNWARARRTLRVELEVRSENNSAIGFYEHVGFRQNGLRRGYYTTPDDDAVLMNLTLEACAEAVIGV